MWTYVLCKTIIRHYCLTQHEPYISFLSCSVVMHQNLKILNMNQNMTEQMAKQMSSMEQVLLTLIDIVNDIFPYFLSSLCFIIFSVPCIVATAEICVSESAQQVTAENRTRINSRYLRELTLGKFIIQYKNLTQMENIGQGTLLQ